VCPRSGDRHLVHVALHRERYLPEHGARARPRHLRPVVAQQLLQERHAADVLLHGGAGRVRGHHAAVQAAHLGDAGGVLVAEAHHEEHELPLQRGAAASCQREEAPDGAQLHAKQLLPFCANTTPLHPGAMAAVGGARAGTRQP